MIWAESLVLDASMTLAWLLTRASPVEQHLAANCLAAVRNNEAIVPDLWHVEIANVLCLYERRRILTAEASDGFLMLLNSLPIDTDDARIGSRREPIRLLARRHGLSGYDALYLDLALRRDATLATFDRRLADACRAAGGRVLGDSHNAVHEPLSAFSSEPKS